MTNSRRTSRGPVAKKHCPRSFIRNCDCKVTKVFPYNRRARCFFRAGRNRLLFTRIRRKSRRSKRKMHKIIHY